MPCSSINQHQGERLVFLRALRAFVVHPFWVITKGGTGFRTGILVAALACSPVLAQQNLLRNPGFEEPAIDGAVPPGWRAIDQNLEFWDWLAPRVEHQIGDVLPRSGRHMAGLDTEMMGVDTNGTDYHIPRSALYQTVKVPGRNRGIFSIYYNDLGSTALSHVSALRLAYTINHTEIGKIQYLSEKHHDPDSAHLPPNTWSEPFYRVAQRLPGAYTAVNDWSLAAVTVTIESDQKEVELTVWIGVFDHQNSTEIGYWRIDDAAFVIHAPPASRPATEERRSGLTPNRK